jgi:hypothetical protein
MTTELYVIVALIACIIILSAQVVSLRLRMDVLQSRVNRVDDRVWDAHSNICLLLKRWKLRIVKVEEHFKIEGADDL